MRRVRENGGQEREQEREREADYSTCPFIDIFTFEKPLSADPH